MFLKGKKVIPIYMSNYIIKMLWKFIRSQQLHQKLIELMCCVRYTFNEIRWSKTLEEAI